MRIAVVCLAYLGNPSGVALLEKYFSRLEAHVFVHVDAKVPLSPYETLNESCNLTLLPERREIFWGGFNTVEVAVDSIEFAQNAGHFDRFLFITEDSIPLLTPREMQDRLVSDVDWIAIHANNPQWVWQRYENFFFFDSRATSFRYFEAGERFITEEDLRRLDRMRLLLREGKSPLRELYHGCGWWALSRDTVNAVIECHHSERRLRESFEFSAIPEEQYFHTIIGSLKLPTPRRNFMYVDWDRDSNVKPYVFSRYAELNEVKKMNPELLFVRKIDLGSHEVGDFVEELVQ